MKRSNRHFAPLTVRRDIPALAQEVEEDIVVCIPTGSNFSSKLCFFTDLFNLVLNFESESTFVKS